MDTHQELRLSDLLESSKSETTTIDIIHRPRRGEKRGETKTSPVRKITFHTSQLENPEVHEVKVKQTDRVLYVEAIDCPIAILLPPIFDIGKSLTIKRLHSSNHRVYIRSSEGQKIENEEIWSLEGDVQEAFVVRWFERNWHIVG